MVAADPSPTPLEALLQTVNVPDLAGAGDAVGAHVAAGAAEGLALGRRRRGASPPRAEHLLDVAGAADRLADDVPPEEKERRRKAVDELQERIVSGINSRLLGHKVEILVEGRHKGKWRGRTRTNKLVFFAVGGRDLTGQLVQVPITQTGPWSMQGSVAEV